MIVRYRARARADLNAIFSYLNELSPSAANKVIRAIHASAQMIAEQPMASPKTDDPEVRVKVVRQYRYKIFYVIGADSVEILHIRHTSRTPFL